MSQKRRKRIIESPAQFDGPRTDKSGNNRDNDDPTRLMLMTAMAEIGVSADEYADFLNTLYSIDYGKMIGEMRNRHAAICDSDSEEEDDDLFQFMRRGGHVEEAKAMPDAEKKSLRIKVQMKDVTKPPMWREVVIPADFNFTQLHYAIQAVTNLGDAHLWQFQHCAYDPELQIGLPYDNNDGFGLDEWTHNANTTPVTGFLAKKGDKLEYVYDFGDDWIFTVSVLEVMERDGDVAVCTKWKCDLQPIDDCGGVYSYLRLREIADSPKSLNAKQKKEIADCYGFDRFDDFMMWLDEANIDIKFVNEELADISVK